MQKLVVLAVCGFASGSALAAVAWGALQDLAPSDSAASSVAGSSGWFRGLLPSDRSKAPALESSSAVESPGALRDLVPAHVPVPAPASSGAAHGLIEDSSSSGITGSSGAVRGLIDDATSSGILASAGAMRGLIGASAFGMLGSS